MEKPIKKQETQTDICLLLEGSYPYIAGGVSTWVHQLISAYPELTFSLVCILAKGSKIESKYKLAENVKQTHNLFFERKTAGIKPGKSERKAMAESIISQMEILSTGKAKDSDLTLINQFLKEYNNKLDIYALLETEQGWDILIEICKKILKDNSFLVYFWSFKSILLNFYSIIGSPLPYAKIYHTISTGYAGLLAALAKKENNTSMIVTEHGIYTNERRIEITTADWLESQPVVSSNLTIDQVEGLSVKDIYMNLFTSFSGICYDAADKIVTLYSGNQQAQTDDGADIKKMMIIPNGVDVKTFAALPKKPFGPPFVIALIGRVVTIKDIKTFIRSVKVLSNEIQSFKAIVAGPTDEDPKYYDECLALRSELGIDEILNFPGRLNMKEFLPTIDINVLTSISEAQPLVILEAGASGIPTVATNVGSCYELIYGRNDEVPKIEPGGLVVPVSDPQAMSNAIARLLNDENLYQSMSRAIKERVHTYYTMEMQNKSYLDLYNEFLNKM